MCTARQRAGRRLIGRGWRIGELEFPVLLQLHAALARARVFSDERSRSAASVERASTCHDPFFASTHPMTARSPLSASKSLSGALRPPMWDSGDDRQPSAVGGSAQAAHGQGLWPACPRASVPHLFPVPGAAPGRAVPARLAWLPPVPLHRLSAGSHPGMARSPAGDAVTAPEKRYGTRRWKATRLRVLRRDLWACWVPDCLVVASVADHIDPVYAGMPDARFFDEANLRASCKRHNTARGVAARLEREAGGLADPEPRNPLTAPLPRPRPPASPMVAAPDARLADRPRVPYHAHTDSSGFVILTGHMSPGYAAVRRLPVGMRSLGLSRRPARGAETPA